jgi:polysaccharide deacetylase family protein (PEP-CTERM system associated)
MGRNVAQQALHTLTIDVEDWYHVCGYQPEVPPVERRVSTAVASILRLLAELRVKATFFILGSVAEDEPELVESILEQGHELASHGYSHRLLHELTSDQFREELERTETILKCRTGIVPVGFRAPQWSVSSRTPWVETILTERGYLYDSSRNPLPFVGDRAAPRHPYRLDTAHGTLWEIPPMVSSSLFGNLPTGGGWGFRLFPFEMIAATVAACERENRPAVFYLHPREVDPHGPRLRLAPLKRFVAYGTRRDALPRVRSLLEKFTFTTLKELVETWHPAS